MRKLILITAVVLASASAQADERSLSLGGAGLLPAAASNSVNTADKVADVERAAPVAAPAPQPQAQPALQQTPVQQQANVQPSAVSDAKPAPEQRTTWYRSSHRRHARRWTEGRIIGELHRHGI